MTERFHYCSDPIRKLKRLPGLRQIARDKPAGLWYSCSDDSSDGWAEWCVAEGFNIGNLVWRHPITVNLSRMIVIRNTSDFDAFVRKYGVGYSGCSRYKNVAMSIDWPRVSCAADGIEIAPHLWDRHLDGGLWYYGWDCASGVVWRKRAVVAIGQVEIGVAK